jgi:hypothetical protein
MSLGFSFVSSSTTSLQRDRCGRQKFLTTWRMMMILACFLILINHEFVAFFAFDDTFVARAAAPP